MRGYLIVLSRHSYALVLQLFSNYQLWRLQSACHHLVRGRPYKQILINHTLAALTKQRQATTRHFILPLFPTDCQKAVRYHRLFFLPQLCTSRNSLSLLFFSYFCTLRLAIPHKQRSHAQLKLAANSNYKSVTYIVKLQTRTSYSYYKIFKRWSFTVCIFSSVLRSGLDSAASLAAHRSHITIKKINGSHLFSTFHKNRSNTALFCSKQGLGWSADQKRLCFKENSEKIVDRAPFYPHA